MSDFVTLFDGVCDQTKKLQLLSGSMANDVKWIISSSGRHMFVKFAVGYEASNSTGFLAKIHFGKSIMDIWLPEFFKKVSHSQSH